MIMISNKEELDRYMRNKDEKERKLNEAKEITKEYPEPLRSIIINYARGDKDVIDIVRILFVFYDVVQSIVPKKCIVSENKLKELVESEFNTFLNKLSILEVFYDVRITMNNVYSRKYNSCDLSDSKELEKDISVLSFIGHCNEKFANYCKYKFFDQANEGFYSVISSLYIYDFFKTHHNLFIIESRNDITWIDDKYYDTDIASVKKSILFAFETVKKFEDKYKYNLSVQL